MVDVQYLNPNLIKSSYYPKIGLDVLQINKEFARPSTHPMTTVWIE